MCWSTSGKLFHGGWTNPAVRSLCPGPRDLCVAAPSTWSRPQGDQPFQFSNPPGCSQRWKVTFLSIRMDNLYWTSLVIITDTFKLSAFGFITSKPDDSGLLFSRPPRLHWNSCTTWCRCGSTCWPIRFPSPCCLHQSESEYCEEIASAR